jgi:hypothetical protein
VGSLSNKAAFFSGASPEADKPVKIPILTCDFQWDADHATYAWDNLDLPVGGFPHFIVATRSVLPPPIQGGNLLVSGEWTAKVHDPATGQSTILATGPLVDGDIEIEPSRAKLTEYTLKVPSGASHLSGVTHFDIDNLVVQAARDSLGLYDMSSQDILACFNPKEPDDFQNTIAHEIGHAFKQVCKPGSAPSGIPDHPYPEPRQSEWWHCAYQRNRCLMYRAGPVPGSLGQFCPVCQPYVLVEDMSKLL